MSDPKPARGAKTLRRPTRRSVFVIERLSRCLITAGGLGTILAVCLVFFFLLWVVVPLFVPSDAKQVGQRPLDAGWQATPPLEIGTDEYRNIGWAYFPDGTIETFRLDTGERLARRAVGEGPAPTAASVSPTEGTGVYGFADGTIRFGRLALRVRHVEPDQLPEELRKLEKGEHATYKEGLLDRTPEGEFRHHVLATGFTQPIEVKPPSKILLVDFSKHGDTARIAAVTEDGRVVLQSTRERENLLTGETTLTVTAGEVRPPQFTGREPPSYVLMSDVGDSVYVVWGDGSLVRIDSRDVETPEVVEVRDLVPEPDGRVTALRFMAGRTTLAVGDSFGRLRGWFRIKPEDAGTKDGAILVAAHDLEAGDAAVTSIATAQRSRMLVVAYGDGSARVFEMTTEAIVAEVDVGGGEPLRSVGFSPKSDGIVGTTGSRFYLWHIDADHADVSLASLFLPVWYEGYEEPTTAYQSSAATADSEAKLGMWPLIFGTIKATIYSLLFGAPLAILAAIFTSEFLSGKTKARVKPAIEMMASLPSVVLGFLAAIVIAPWVEECVPQVLSCIVTVPFAALLGANLWQSLPGQGRTGRLRPWRVPALFVMAAAGIGLGFLVGPAVESLVFEGDIKKWLDGQVGTGTGAWMFPMLPLAAMLVAVGMSLFVNPELRRISGDWGPGAMARAELVKFLVGFVAVLALALLLSWLLNLLWDPRGTYVGTYVQRNAMIVGFVMGFAIIPIIYTISEDALAGVPDHLRAASLGAGATAWQTAIRVILPTGLSGIFSALMVGFGRAVGETMIVLMAAGNTALLDWNIFNGFRTLSANIATEMPEAPRGSTHYRTLFLAALVLFAMTFVVNTAAEAVRLRVRRRAYEL